ncbi:MAG: hypothetical protein HKN48_09975 [Flavobacteriaceae bacterium]|nr:hypothetical protein [Flavobacteriaceae bacterium]
MKKAVFAVCIMMLMLLPGQIFAQEENTDPKEPTKESMDSFYNLIDGIKWKDYEVVEDKDTKRDCYPELINRFKALVPKLLLKRNNNEAYRSAMDRFQSVQRFINQGNFQNLGVKNTGGFPNLVRDHFFNYLSQDLEPQTYREKIIGAGNANDTEVSLMDALRWLKYNARGHLAKRDFNQAGCNIYQLIKIEPTNHDVANAKITWAVTNTVTINCDCTERKNSKRLDRGTIKLKSEVTSTYLIKGIFNIIFTEASKPKQESLMVSCCPDPIRDESDKPADDNGGDGNNGNGDSKGDGSDSKSEKDKDCCFPGENKFTIGLFPLIAVENNFEDSGFGIGVEGLYNIGTSFGNNEFYAGLQAQYLTESSQEGEVTQNTFSGAAILENRTPILPCVQWVQRICGQYSTGTIEAFNNKDDFDGLTFGIHTGFNLDVSENVAIGLDATVVTFGKTTFTPENGPDIEQDIGEFNLGGKQVRFGIRFKW